MAGDAAHRERRGRWRPRGLRPASRWRGHRRRARPSCPCGSAWRRCPARSIDVDRAGLLAHPGTGPGRAVPAVAPLDAAGGHEHRRARASSSPTARSWARRRCSRHVRRDSSAWPSSPTISRQSAATARASWRWPGPSEQRSCPIPATASPDGGRRSALAFSVRNEPGTLVRALGVIAGHGINMTKLESRPSRQGAWEYVFWVDLDADVCAPDGAGDAFLADLNAVCVWVRVMGCYPRGVEPRVS